MNRKMKNNNNYICIFKVVNQPDFIFFNSLCFKQAVSENISLKQRIFAELESYCPPHCILASTTSMINFNLINGRRDFQNRIVGIHFFWVGLLCASFCLVSNLSLM